LSNQSVTRSFHPDGVWNPLQEQNQERNHARTHSVRLARPARSSSSRSGTKGAAGSFLLADALHSRGCIQGESPMMSFWQDVRYGLREETDRKSTRLNSSHVSRSYAVFCLKKKSRIETPLGRKP